MTASASRIVNYFVVFFSSLAPIGTVWAATLDNCKTLEEPDRARLLEYVKRKYKLGGTLALQVRRESFVGPSCFRKLDFGSADPTRNFRLELYLSPDLRFLTPELLDLSVDPVAEERQKQRAMSKGLTMGNFPMIGPKDAPVTITIFSDFQCPYCARMAHMLNRDVLPAERKTTRLVFRYFPLTFHNWALPAAQAAACAQEQGDDYFWRLHDFLFEHQREFTSDNVSSLISSQAKLFQRFDSKRFDSCVAGRKTEAKVEADITFGNRIGVSGTPTLYINGERAAAVSTPEQLRTLIREARSPSAKMPNPAQTQLQGALRNEWLLLVQLIAQTL